MFSRLSFSSTSLSCRRSRTSYRKRPWGPSTRAPSDRCTLDTSSLRPSELAGRSCDRSRSCSASENGCLFGRRNLLRRYSLVKSRFALGLDELVLELLLTSFQSSLLTHLGGELLLFHLLLPLGLDLFLGFLDERLLILRTETELHQHLGEGPEVHLHRISEDAVVVLEGIDVAG